MNRLGQAGLINNGEAERCLQRNNRTMGKENIKRREKELINLTSEFCEKHINDEYTQLCEKLIRKMGRKRSVPFERGQLNIWAASVIHSLAIINFLFDPDTEPHVTIHDIHNYFKTNRTTVAGKSKKIRDMFEMWHFSPEFSTQKMSENNPLNGMVMVNGYIVPIDTLPEESQNQVREARAKGEDISFYTD